jgi:hypothetical protein
MLSEYDELDPQDADTYPVLRRPPTSAYDQPDDRVWWSEDDDTLTLPLHSTTR